MSTMRAVQVSRPGGEFEMVDRPLPEIARILTMAGLEVDEIVMITGLSPGKIKSNLYCARQFIKEKLESVCK